MNIELIDNPEQEFITFLDDKIAEYNWQRWEVSERKPLAMKMTDEQGKIIAGAAGRSFGDWFMLNTLWVDEQYRGKKIGDEILTKIEMAAKERGCNKCLLDTLNFQAMPFYQARGYLTQWIQEGYPKTGCKYYMMKHL